MSLIRNINRYFTLKRVVIIVLCLIIVAGGVSVYFIINNEPPLDDLLQREISRLEEEVEQNPNDLDKKVELAVLYSDAGFHDKAIEQLESVLESEEEYRDALVLLGYIYIETERYEEAIPSYQKIIELNQDNPMKHISRQLEGAYYYLGVAYLNLDMFTEAIQSFEQALNIDRTDADAWCMLGESYLNYGVYQEAIICFEKAISFVPDFREAYHGLALCYEKTGQMNLVLYAQGMEDYSAGLTKEAISKLEEAVAKNSDIASVYLGLGLAYEDNGELEKAIIAYEQALRIDPNLWLAKAKVDALKVKG